VPCETVEEFGVFGHAAHVNLKEGKAILKRGELLKELFLSELLFRETVFVFVVSVEKTLHDNAPSRWIGSCIYTTENVIVDFRSCASFLVLSLSVGDVVAMMFPTCLLSLRPKRRGFSPLPLFSFSSLNRTSASSATWSPNQ
jgi:hypothetical protein